MYFVSRLILHISIVGTGFGLFKVSLNLSMGAVLTQSLVSRCMLSRFDPVLVLALAPRILATTATSLLGLLSRER